MPAPTRTNERPGTRAVLRHCRTSAFKVRPVLDLIRGQQVERAQEILRFSERDAATVVGKVLTSAVANAENNEGLDPETLYVSACYADEATTLKRWRPRARGRATRIRKRTSHVTVVVSRLPEEQLLRLRARQQAEAGGQRARRVAGGRQGRRQRREAAQRAQATQAAPPTAAQEAAPGVEETAPDRAAEQPAEAVEPAADATASGAVPTVEEAGAHGAGDDEEKGE
jgi:large subunit ribosomal protein L22